MSKKNRYLRRDKPFIEPLTSPPQFVPRTESEEARRATREWLRERDEDDVPDWDDLNDPWLKDMD